MESEDPFQLTDEDKRRLFDKHIGEYDVTKHPAYRAGLLATAKVADERKRICFDAAKKHTDACNARTEQCAGMEAQHIAESIRQLADGGAQ